MYEHLNGKIIEKTPTSVVIEIGGVGYHVLIPLSTYTQLPEPGASAKILTHFIVREDAQSLFGFISEEERGLFRMLLSVSGIGPKTALTALSGVRAGELKEAIVNGEIETLTQISGIGRKTAERMIVELKEKLVVEERRAPTRDSFGKVKSENRVLEDALRALVELGYKKPGAQEAVQRAAKLSHGKPVTLEELVRQSLKFV